LTTKFTKIFTKNTKEKIAYFHEGGWNHLVVLQTAMPVPFVPLVLQTAMLVLQTEMLVLQTAMLVRQTAMLVLKTTILGLKTTRMIPYLVTNKSFFNNLKFFRRFSQIRTNTDKESGVRILTSHSSLLAPHAKPNTGKQSANICVPLWTIKTPMGCGFRFKPIPGRRLTKAFRK